MPDEYAWFNVCFKYGLVQFAYMLKYLYKKYAMPFCFFLSTVSSSITCDLIFHTEKFLGWGIYSRK